MKTLFISKKDVHDLISVPELIEGLKKAYITYSNSKNVKPQRALTNIEQTSVVINFPGYQPESTMFTVKINTKNPNNRKLNLPFLMGTILLIDKDSGALLAVIESSLITAMRTGAAGALGIQTLANDNANHIALIGAGIQGEWQIRALHSVQRLKKVALYDINSLNSKRLASKLNELNIDAHIAKSIKDALIDANVVILTTQSHSPIITADLIVPGLHINAFGADQPGKVELDSHVINQYSVIVDDKEIAFSHGSLNVAHANNQIKPSKQILEIGDILANKYAGRNSIDEVTIFANTGLAFQDLVACAMIYEKAIKLSKGVFFDFEST